MPDYIHRISIGSFDECQKTIAEAGKILYDLNRRSKISGYLIFIASKFEDISLGFADTNYQDFTEGLFPFVISGVIKIKDIGLDLEALMKSLDFETLTLKPITSISIPQNQI